MACGADLARQTVTSDQSRTLLTADDLLLMPDDGRFYELLDGKLVEMTPPGGMHGKVSAGIPYALLSHVRAHELGEVLSNDPGVILHRQPDRVRAPDVCFIARDRLPPGGLPDGYLELVPDLVVEVISPGDRAAEVQAKIEHCLNAGARLVWAVYPHTRSVVTYQSLAAVPVYSAGEILTGEPVLPGFACPVASLFA